MGDSDDDRRAILARRSRFIALALGGITSASAGCYESHGLDRRPDAMVSVDSGDPLPCLSRRPEDAGPDPCLGIALDAGADASPDPCLGVAVDAGADAGDPFPCLSKSPVDAGRDAGPDPCLSAPKEW